MARINFDDDVESQEEFWRLLNIFHDRDKCLGILIRFFRLAQKRYGHSEPITDEDICRDGLECMITTGWAIPVLGGYEGKGAEKHFGWYKQRVEAGKTRSDASRDKEGRFKKKPGTAGKKRRSSGNGEIASGTVSEHPQPTSENGETIQPLALAPSLALSNKSHFATQNGESLPDVTSHQFNPVGLWILAYKKKYGVRYELKAQDVGSLSRFAKGKKPSELARLYACFLAIESRLYADAKHPLSLFFRDLQKISVASQTMVDPSKAEQSGVEQWALANGVELE